MPPRGDPGTAPAQVAASLLVLAAKPDGSSQMSLTLHPKELGAVHIELDRSAGGVIRINVTASDPMTLRSLMSDQAHLHAALDAAAVPSANRHLSFELGTPPSSVAAPVHPGSVAVADRTHEVASGHRAEIDNGQDLSGFRSFDQQGGGGPANERGGDFTRSRRSTQENTNDDTAAGLQSSFLPATARTMRSGRVNITA